jgi:hypothetical protein
MAQGVHLYQRRIISFSQEKNDPQGPSLDRQIAGRGQTLHRHHSGCHHSTTDDQLLPHKSIKLYR